MRSIRRISLLFILAFGLFSFIGARVVWNSSYQQLLADHQAQLDRFSSHILTKLDKYAHLPRLLARDRKLIEALQNSMNPAQIDITNRYLEQINETIGASDTYLLDEQANTIAASNWLKAHSFVGRNFSWRPYYSEAMAGEPSQYFALGSTSGERGYYYSAPVIYAASQIGVIVVKMDLSSIEKNWQSDNSYFVATDKNNVIFMSSNQNWLFKSVSPLPLSTLNAIRESRQYLDKTIHSLNLAGPLNHQQSEWINRSKGWLKGDFIVTSRPLAEVPLTIRVLTPKITLFWASFSFITITALLFIIGYLATLLYQHKQLKQRQLERVQSEAKQKLEYLVMERTAKLHAEINERSKTEQQLRKTQSELIQAAKLAVLGQMSASISHELNNPLAAIRSFADNGRRFIQAGKSERAEENLERISNLTERMAQISTQLKSFAKKADHDDLSKVQLTPVLLSAKELLTGPLKSSGAILSLFLPQPPIYLWINPIQLEQVVINLITNAIQATEENEDKVIHLSVQKQTDRILIRVEDNGRGINPEQKAALFDPFYTTKKNGLGLGLSISQQIIDSMDGTLTVSDSDLGGASFDIHLPLITTTNQTENHSITTEVN